MAADTTKLTIELQSILKGLNQTLRGLDQVKRKLDSLANVKTSSQIGTASIDKAALASQRLAVQQQKLAIQAQELANRQERARQTAERLTVSNQKLIKSQQQAAVSTGVQADAHVKAFRAIQRGLVDANQHVQFFRANEAALAKAPQLDSHVRAFQSLQRGIADADAHVKFFRNNEAALKKAPQLDAHVQAFRALQKGVDDADAHVRFFKANEAALAKAPQLDAHVRAFRALEDASKRVTAEQERARKSILTLDQSLSRIGGSLRNLGQGLTSLGSSLSIALTAPLAALGVIATQNAVTLDSLKRGLEAITGSADEAGVQLERLTEIAKLPGIGFQEAIQGSIRLQAVGFSAEQAERALVQFSNAVALTGGGRAELERITVQLGQLSAKGKVLSQDLKPIIEAGPAVGKALKEAFGTVNAEDIQALGLSSEQFLDRLVKQLEKLPRAAGGARNTLENFSDSLFRASAAIGDAILPVLTQLINIVEPVITALANGFKSLPPILQVLVIGFGGLLAAIGPTLFILGQFATGIGGLLSAFARLHALGLIPTIRGFQLLGQVMRGAAGLAAGQAATTAAAAAGWIALGAGVLIAVGALVLATGAIAAYVDSQKKSNKVSSEQIKATNDQINSLKSQISFVDSLAGKVNRTAEEENRLAEIYERLNTQAKVRVTGISDEEKRLEQLRKELERLLALRREEQGQQAANLAANLANTTAQIKANERAREDISTQIQVNTRLAQSIQSTGKINRDQAKQLAETLKPLGQNIGDVETATRALNLRNESLIEQQAQLIDSAKELTTKASEQGDALSALEKNGAGTTRQFLVLAKQIGIFQGDIEEALTAMNRFIEAQRVGVPVLDAFTRALEQQNKELVKAGEAADALAKGRHELIGAAVSLAKEASGSFSGALADLRAFIAAQPDLRAAFEKEAQLAGKSFDEFVQEALGGKRDRAGTSLRNAQEQLAKAVEGVAEASAVRQRSIERDKNEKLLQENENAFRLQLIAFEQYIRDREFLTRQNIELEIKEQEALHARALAEQERFLARSRKAGIPPAERTRSIAEAAEAEQKAIEAETRIRQLRAEQQRVAVEANQAISEAAKQQIEDVRKLDIEFAELRGSIEDALNTATIEKFRERLLALGKAQENIRKQLELSRALGPEETERLRQQQRLNQSEIDLIELIKEQEFATNKLAAANEFLRRAKQKQAELEQELSFQVEFRGLKEEDAIKKRLEGERKLADSLRVVRDLVQSEIDALNAKGINPPQALLDFVRETTAAIKGLGELPFSEQFRLVEKEFNRLNEERLDKIADIERAIRERDIAEAEGLLIIRRINGQYSADLERQVELLKQIAAQSNDVSLQRQAQQAEQTTKDATAELASFNRQLRSTSIDALQDSLTDFFTSLKDRTKDAKEKLLDLVNSVATRIEQLIAENLSRRLVESLFGGVSGEDGILTSIGRLFGLGQGKGSQGRAGAVAAAGVTQATQATAAATALTTGATAAATALTTGGVSAGTALVTSATAAATAFASSVIAAGAAFAASIAAAGATSGISQGLGGLGSAIGAATGIFPATPGGVVRIVEGGFPEAVLTTDPKHAARQVAILRAFLKETKGLGGRIRGLAAGGFTDRIDISAPRVSLSNSGIGELAVAGTPSTMRLRQVLVDQRSMGDWVNSSEGEQVFVDFLFKHAPVIRRIGGK